MPIIIVGIILTLFGILSIYSVSIHESFTLTISLIANGKMDGDPSNYFYFFRQLRNIALALVMAGIVYAIPIRFFQKNKNTTIIAIILMALQVSVFIPGIGIVLNGARGWINIPFLPSIQPAEFFKLGYVLFLGGWLMRKRERINTKEFFISFIILNALLFFVFLLIPDLGTVMILGIVGLIMCRYAGAKIKYILWILFGGIITGLLLGGIAGMVSDRFAYIQKRFTYFISSSVDPQAKQIGWQNEQALLAIGGGGFLGKGYGKGLQKFGFIPEAQSDFVFAAFSEEIGFVGNMILLSLYLYIGWYFLTNLRHIKDEHRRMIGIGILSLILIQAFVNIGVNIKILPNTGLTLPFISYGGTALMVNFMEIILLYKILQRNK
ncbi:MAG TPA: FtsW/RodA/SpoVE family cell cycle protein [Candidatus Absconditabacterales bacterium]|nr:FtsW/RodA/SpoVE family cell cycle protein [Candidatus Absconditabacterales bacterium]